MEYLDRYIEPLGVIYFGEDARHLLNNKLPLLSIGSRGIFEADKERWNEAQVAEEFLWMDIEALGTSDRNEDHKIRFENYSMLEGRHFKSVIELGCGPYTNVVRMPYREWDNITLLDPLIDKYLTHKNCSYKKAHEKVKLIKSSIEAFETSEKYDLVIMINVLEHCYSAEEVLTKVVNILSSDGVFVFSESGTDEGEIIKKINYTYDAFHPLTFSNEWIEETTENNFDVEYKKVFRGLYDCEHRSDFYYVLRHKKRGEKND